MDRVSVEIDADMETRIGAFILKHCGTRTDG